MDFDCLVSPYLSDLSSYCVYLTGSKWDGEDLYQETLMKLYVYSSNMKNRQGLKALMFRIAKNIWIDDYRKRRSRVFVNEIIYLPPHRDRNYAEIRGYIEELADKLPERYMEMLLLTEILDYSMQEIAEFTHTTVPAVKCAIHRARKLLKTAECSQTKTKMSRRADIERWSQVIVYDRQIV